MSFTENYSVLQQRNQLQDRRSCLTLLIGWCLSTMMELIGGATPPKPEPVDMTLATRVTSTGRAVTLAEMTLALKPTPGTDPLDPLDES